MHMSQMVGAVTVVYFVTLLLLCLYHNKINVKVGNILFAVVDVLFFFCWNYAGFIKHGISDGFMTLGNISPLMFTVIPLTFIMRPAVRDAAYSAIAFLSVGMFLAMIISPEHAYLFSFNEKSDFWYASEAVCHMVCSLFGFYLVLTDQVKVDTKHLLKSMLFMYSIITYAVFLNIVFHKDFFGMDPYGNYRIYMLNIFGSFEATLLAYYLGILVVLIVGMQASHLLHRWTRHKKEDI